MKPSTCCICDPNLTINPFVCERHKLEGLRRARERQIRYSEAAGDLYREARAATAPCGVCEKRVPHLTDLDICAVCDECILAGKIEGVAKPVFPGLTFPRVRPALA